MQNASQLISLKYGPMWALKNPLDLKGTVSTLVSVKNEQAEERKG